MRQAFPAIERGLGDGGAHVSSNFPWCNFGQVVGDAIWSRRSVGLGLGEDALKLVDAGEVVDAPGDVSRISCDMIVVSVDDFLLRQELRCFVIPEIVCRLFCFSCCAGSCTTVRLSHSWVRPLLLSFPAAKDQQFLGALPFGKGVTIAFRVHNKLGLLFQEVVVVSVDHRNNALPGVTDPLLDGVEEMRMIEVADVLVGHIVKLEGLA
eukprot:8796996-Pyramimonas_sp.AAC.1